MAWGMSATCWFEGRNIDMAQANVMLSYPVDEAEVLLNSKLTSAKTSLSNCEEDLDFLREQITVCVHTYPVL
jgi:hypothetical protein